MRVDLTITGSYHFPISTSMHIGSDSPYEAQSSFKLNVSLLESVECRVAIARVWFFVPTPVKESGWISWWEATLLCTTKFLALSSFVLS